MPDQAMTTDAPLEPRLAREARYAQYVLPGETNNYGTLFGGTLLQWMDKVAAIAAMRFCQRPCVTASLESLDFRRPIHAGSLVEIIARVIYTGRTSMIVQLEVYTEELDGQRHLCTHGYFSLVAVDASGQPAPIPPLLVEDEEARRAWQLGEEIRARAMARRSAR